MKKVNKFNRGIKYKIKKQSNSIRRLMHNNSNNNNKNIFTKINNIIRIIHNNNKINFYNNKNFNK
jgi:hypothetical protein